jgi:hypothetical protein
VSYALFLGRTVFASASRYRFLENIQYDDFVEYERIIFSGHAIRQMFSRGIRTDDVLGIIGRGEEIADYADDRPYPSKLILGFIKNVPIHVVLAIDTKTKTGIIVTAYIPDSQLWSDDFRSRRKK